MYSNKIFHRNVYLPTSNSWSNIIFIFNMRMIAFQEWNNVPRILISMIKVCFEMSYGSVRIGTTIELLKSFNNFSREQRF